MQIFSTRMILQNRINRIKATWRNRCFEKMDDHHFTPYQTTTLPKWMFSHKLLFKTSLLLIGQCAIQVSPPNNSDDLCLLFCIYPSSMAKAHARQIVSLPRVVSSRSEWLWLAWRELGWFKPQFVAAGMLHHNLSFISCSSKCCE